MNEDGDNPVGRVPSRGAPVPSRADTRSDGPEATDVGRVPPPGVPTPSRGAPNPNDPPPRRLRRLHRVWPDRDGNISYLLTICVDGRGRVLDNEDTFQRLVSFLLDSPPRYRWFGRRFVIMPDYIHVIARMGYDAIRLGQWIKALKAVVAGLKPREERPVGAPGLQDGGPSQDVGPVPPPGVPVPAPPIVVGRVPSPGAPVPSPGAPVPSPGAPVPSPGAPVPSPGVPVPPPAATPHEFTRIPRPWRWQAGFHDHKLRTPESETRKWEYVCLNPVRYHLVERPEEWPFGGEIFYDDAGGPRLIRGTPPLLETGMLIEKDGTPREGTRPTP